VPPTADDALRIRPTLLSCLRKRVETDGEDPDQQKDKKQQALSPNLAFLPANRDSI